MKKVPIIDIKVRDFTLAPIIWKEKKLRSGDTEYWVWTNIEKKRAIRLLHDKSDERDWYWMVVTGKVQKDKNGYLIMSTDYTETFPDKESAIKFVEKLKKKK